MISNIVMLLLFAISMIGYIMYLEKKLKLQIEFMPIISIALITILLFLGGLLNILPLLSIILFMLGIYLFIFEVYTNIRGENSYHTVKKYLTPGIILFVIVGIYFLFMLKDQHLIHYDNFSHWGLIVKNMLNSNALPNFENSTIQFKSYPPGSALFIYYFCFFVGKSEGLALFSQLLIILSSILTLFSFSSFSVFNLDFRKGKVFKNVILSFIPIFSTLYLLNGPSSIHNLLVDTLVSVVGIATFSLVYYYFNSPTKIFFPLILLSSFLILIKNSGMFFAYLAIIIYCIALFNFWKKDHVSVAKNLLKKKYFLFIPVISPLAVFYLWSKHVSMVFSADSLGKHAMSFESYMNNFNEKTVTEIREITINFIETVQNGTHLRQFILIIIILVTLIIIGFVITKVIDKRLMVITIVVSLIFTFYVIGLWLMYLVSMPTSEALDLAGYSRYMSTIVHYLIGVSVVSIIYYLANMEGTKTFIISGSISLIFIAFLAIGGQNFHDIKLIFQNAEVANDVTELTIDDIDNALTNLSPNQLISTGNNEPYLVYYPKKGNTGYEKYYLQYRLLQNNVAIAPNLDYLLVGLWKSNYLVVTEVTDELEKVFELYSEEEPQIGTYRIDNKNQQIMNKIVY